MPKFIIFIFFCCNILHAVPFGVAQLSASVKSSMMEKNSWRPGCVIPRERLRLVTFKHYDFDGKEQNGEIVVLDAVAHHVLAIFKQLYALKFPISKAKRLEYYDAVDEKSLADNNTAGFICRAVTGGGAPSLHSYGLAIDINPIQNPYIAPKNLKKAKGGSLIILPAQGASYLNRRNERAGMAEPIVDIFKQHGFTVWGGTWNDPVDWQHFQVPRVLAQLLGAMTMKDAQEFFAVYVKNNSILGSVTPDNNELVQQYLANKIAFMKKFKSIN